MKGVKVKFKFSEKVPLIVLGDGMKNKDTVKLKGLTSGVTGILRRELQKRQAVYKNAIVDINEFRTSKVLLIHFVGDKKI
jgi:hypothetical protein